MDPADLATLPGVSPSRAHQIVPGALVAEGVMDIFDLAELQICPWALREGVILERLDQLSDKSAQGKTAQDESAQDESAQDKGAR
jgi:exopolyphosphatase/guanosine-5'-triphosphate,3'-diphosphate pyrophosphatase